MTRVLTAAVALLLTATTTDGMAQAQARLRLMWRSARVTVAPIVLSMSPRSVTYVRVPFAPRT